MPRSNHWLEPARSVQAAAMRPPVQLSAVPMRSRRCMSATAIRSIRSALSLSLLVAMASPCEVAVERDDGERTAGRDEVVDEDAQALAPADGCATLGLEELVRPAHRPGLGGVEEAEQAEGDDLPDEGAGRDQPQHEPEGQHLVPDDGARVRRVHV